MKKVKHILEIFLHSFIPLDYYYPKLLHTHVQISLKYYFIVLSFLSFLFTAIILWHLSPMKVIGYKNSLVNSFSFFPSDVKIKTNNGILETNQTNPLFLWVYHDTQPFFVFMVNTKDSLAKSYLPIPLLYFGTNEIQVTYRDNTNSLSYKSLAPLLITRETLQTLGKQINTIFPIAAFFFYLILLVGLPLLFMVVTTTLLVLVACIVFIILRPFIPHIHIKKCIQAAFHGTHIPLFIYILFALFFPGALSAVTVVVLTFIFALVATYEMYCKQAPYFKGR